MNSILIGMLAETSVHPGSGQDAGFVDLPVAREAATDYPVIVGSSLKGALLDRARSEKLDESRLNSVFGTSDASGNLIVSDARLVALPVRSLSTAYKWVTCPLLIERLARDAKRTDNLSTSLAIPSPGHGSYLGKEAGDIFLEERQFHHAGELSPAIADAISSLILHDETAKRVQNQLVIVHNDDFAWFAKYGLAISARNVLDPEKKTSDNLWYEETIPPDSIFYFLLAERDDSALTEVAALFQEKPYLQVGGNATVGQGWFAVNYPTTEEAK